MKIEKILGTDAEKNILFVNSEGTYYMINASKYVFGTWYSELSDDAYFAKAAPYYETAIVWPNGQGISPEDVDEFAIPV